MLDPVTQQVVWTLDEVVDSAGAPPTSAARPAWPSVTWTATATSRSAPPRSPLATGSGTERNVVCVNGEDGSLLWLSDNLRRAFMGSPAIANLDGAGAPEVIIGNVVLSGVDGTTLAQAGSSANMGGWGYEESNDYPTAIGVPIETRRRQHGDHRRRLDLDLHRRHQHRNLLLGALHGDRREDEEGFASVADVDLDGEPEIVRTRYVYDGSTGRTKGYVRVLDRNASGTWERPPSTLRALCKRVGTPTTTPTPARAQSATCCAPALPRLPTSTATPKPRSRWRAPILPGARRAGGRRRQHLPCPQVAAGLHASSASTGSSVFDFDADGVSEILYADQRVYIFDGPTGADRIVSSSFDPKSHCSGTAAEFPSIADVDNDGASEILLASAWARGDTSATDWHSWDPDCTDAAEAWQGVRMIQSATDDGTGNGWAPCRPVEPARLQRLQRQRRQHHPHHASGQPGHLEQPAAGPRRPHGA